MNEYPLRSTVHQTEISPLIIYLVVLMVTVYNWVYDQKSMLSLPYFGLGNPGTV